MLKCRAFSVPRVLSAAGVRNVAIGRIIPKPMEVDADRERAVAAWERRLDRLVKKEMSREPFSLTSLAVGLQGVLLWSRSQWNSSLILSELLRDSSSPLVFLHGRPTFRLGHRALRHQGDLQSMIGWVTEHYR
eukprot:Sspe_Gene.67625::Locus_39903_Transcript_1_1_Confidence_1.000_Length_448::g.67625::m.67625